MALDRLVVRIAREGGGKLLDMAVDRLLTGRKQAPADADTAAPEQSAGASPPAGQVSGQGSGRASGTITRKAANAALAQVARRSVPAAIIIGAGVLAKHLYDRRRARQEGGDARS